MALVDGHELRAHRTSSSVTTKLGEEEPATAVPVLSGLRQCSIVAVTTLAMLLNIMQVQGVTLALERIGEDLDMPTARIQWLTTSYSLAFGSLLLLFGRLADIHGHRLVFLIALAWFTLWSVACGLAPNEVAMDVFRAMQGVGMGAAIPSALGILGTSFIPGRAVTSWAFAIFAGGAPIGAGVGFVLGGVLTQYASIGWRAFFYVSAGVSAAVLVGAFFSVPKDCFKDDTLTVDWIGGALITVGLTLFTFALADSSGQPAGWRTSYIPPLFCTGVLLCIAFWFWSRHLEYNTARHPLMRVSLWYKGRFALVQLIAALGWCSFASFMFFATLWLQDLAGLEPMATTIRFLPAPITGIALCAIVGLLAARISATWLIAIGCLGTGIGPLLFALQDIDAPYWQWQFPAFIVAVLGADFIFTVGIMYASKVAGDGHQAAAGGIFNMMTQIGTAIGLAVCTIIQSRVTADGNPASIEAGLRAAFFACSGFALFGFLVTVTCLWGIGRVGARDTTSDNALHDERVIGKLDKEDMA